MLAFSAERSAQQAASTLATIAGIAGSIAVIIAFLRWPMRRPFMFVWRRVVWWPLIKVADDWLARGVRQIVAPEFAAVKDAALSQHDKQNRQLAKQDQQLDKIERTLEEHTEKISALQGRDGH